MLHVRPLKINLVMTIEKSRKLASKPEGEYFIANMSKQASVYLQELGVLGTPKLVPIADYCGGNKHPIKVYPVNFEKAERCLDRLEALSKRHYYVRLEDLRDS